MADLSVVILAAGIGKRMRSRKAKVLHLLGGKPLIAYPVELARELPSRTVVVVVGRDSDEVRATLSGINGLGFAEQREQKGTAHALLQARPLLADEHGDLLVLYGDVPLLQVETVRELLRAHQTSAAAATLLTTTVDEPAGYGRIIREGGRLVRIVEEADATPAERAVQEVWSGVGCFRATVLWPALERVRPENRQGEYYLPEVVRLLLADGQRVETVSAADPGELLGVNDRRQLADLEARLRHRTLLRLMAEGVTILDPATTYVGPDVRIGQDTILSPGVVIDGRTVIGEECVIGPGCHLENVRIAERVTLRPYCVVAHSVIEAGATLGPFAHLRPESLVRAGARVGNFVELKKSVVGKGSKVPHLSYVGDATIGEDVNIGAGTITCNYDGEKKHQTVIGDRAFIGTNSSLVAPLTVGEGAYIAAGSTITEDVPPHALAVARGRQVVKEGWALKRKKKQKGK